MSSRDLTYVTLVSEARDGPDEHDGMMKMIKFDDDVGYLVMKVIQS